MRRMDLYSSPRTSHSNPKTARLRISLNGLDAAQTTQNKIDTKECDSNAMAHLSPEPLPLSPLTSAYSHDRSHTSSTRLTTTTTSPVPSSAPDLQLSPINPEQAVRNQAYTKRQSGDLTHLLVRQCRTKGTKGSGSTSNRSKRSNSRNTGRHNRQNNNRSNDESSKEHSGFGGNNHGWNGGQDGDDEKKRENDKYMGINDDEDDEDEDEDEEEEDDTDMPRKRTLAIHKSKSCGAQPNRYLYSYNPVPWCTKRSIRMSKKLTQVVIPECVKESVADVYDFITKLTAMVLIALYHNIYDGYVVEVADCMILNCGFHDRNTNEVLYLVAAKGIKGSKTNNVYVLADDLYTKRALCDIYQLTERQLPKSWHDKNNMKHMMNQVNDMFSELFNMSYPSSVPWHKLPIHRTMNNKQRLTFSITKTEFIAAFNRSLAQNKRCALIPIIMFNCNGYRTEYVQIVRIRDGIDIGVSYIYNHCRSCFQVTGIHLNRECMLRQHQLAYPHHDCHCLDHFQSIIDDLHIGNPDDDKNRVKDLQNKNRILREKYNSCENQNELVSQLQSENEWLKTENSQITPLKIQLDCLNNLLLQHMRQQSPSTSSSPFLRLTPLPPISVTPVAAYFPPVPPGRVRANSNNVMSWAQYTNRNSLSTTPCSIPSMNNSNYTPNSYTNQNQNQNQNNNNNNNYNITNYNNVKMNRNARAHST